MTHRVAIVWDFDGTLTPVDSSTKVVDFFLAHMPEFNFWDYVHSLRGDEKQKGKPTEEQWQHILASDAPIWMYMLARMADAKNTPLNKEFFKEFILPQIKLYDGVINFLQNLKALTKQPRLNGCLEIHHFIVSAGLKELIELCFPPDLMTWVFGGRYAVTVKDDPNAPRTNVPVFCMDETMKTRSLFEIAKGVFCDKTRKVNSKVDDKDLWVNFSNMIYIGDGDTDVPALSVVRARGGTGIAVYNPASSPEKKKEKLSGMSMNKRADLICPADFSLDGALYKYIETRCHQILQRIEAENMFIAQEKPKVFDSLS